MLGEVEWGNGERSGGWGREGDGELNCCVLKKVEGRRLEGVCIRSGGDDQLLWGGTEIHGGGEWKDGDRVKRRIT